MVTALQRNNMDIKKCSNCSFYGTHNCDKMDGRKMSEYKRKHAKTYSKIFGYCTSWYPSAEMVKEIEKELERV